MASSMFWRKLILLNIGLFIVIVRLYGMIFDKLEKKTSNSSVFPLEDEDGYPFIEHLNCNLRNLYLNSKGFENNIIIPENINLSKENRICSFNDKQLICKNDTICIENLNNNNNSDLNLKFELPLYHVIDEFDGNKFWYAINEQNSFLNKKSLNVIHKILIGYETYINLMIYKKIKDENFLKEKVTYSYENLNSLFYLHSLILQSSFILDDNNIIDIKNKTKIRIHFLKNYYEECINLSSGNLFQFNSLIKEEIIIIFNKIKKIINCIPDNNIISKKSSLIDIDALITILKIYSFKEITENEIENFKFFASNLILITNEIFKLDIKIKRESLKYNNISKNLFIFFWGAVITGILFVNKYFIQYKEYYSRKDKKYNRYQQNMAEQVKKMKQYQENLNKIKEKTSKENNEEYNKDLKKYSPEEIEYIEKITSNSNGKGEEFVFTHQ